MYELGKLLLNKDMYDMYELGKCFLPKCFLFGLICMSWGNVFCPSVFCLGLPTPDKAIFLPLPLPGVANTGHRTKPRKT